MAHVVRVWRTSRIIRFFTLVVLFGTATELLLDGKSPKTKVMEGEGPVPIAPVPDGGGKICDRFPATGPASGEAVLVAALAQRQEARAASIEARNAATQDRSKLKPVRWIHDPYAAFSSVAVDPINNEVVMTDENLFQILVYNRTTTTPPSARFTEPKRMIAGLKTKIEFQCGLYIDPKTGNIYAVNNDTVDTLVIFDRNAKGDVPPTRELHTPHGTFGIAVDESAEEMFLTLQHDSAMVVFRKYAEKDESPLRLLQGDATGIADPHGIVLDTKNGWLFIANHGAVSSRNARPDARPSRRAAQKQNWPLERAAAVPRFRRELSPTGIGPKMKAHGKSPPLPGVQGAETEVK